LDLNILGGSKMAYDDEQAKRSRVVVETPTSRREVSHTEAVRNDRGGISGATVGIIVVVAIALITIVVLFLMNGQNTDTTNENLAVQQQPAQQQPVIIQQPAQQQPPVIIQQPATTAPQQPPVVINQPAPSGGTASSGSDDGVIQSAIDKKISDDPTFSTLGITATVFDGKVTLTGTVKTEALKTQVERMVRATKGVKQVDNQLVAME
jgi:flagellar basal body-associated protein FliL